MAYQRGAAALCHEYLRFVMNAPVMNRGDGTFSSVEKIPAGTEGTYYPAGVYTLYITMRMDQGPRAQAAANVYLNDYLVAPAQTNEQMERACGRCC